MADTIKVQGIQPDPNPQIVEDKLNDEDLLAQFVRTFDRGLTSDRLGLDFLPPDVWGEWIPIDEIDAYKLLGLEIDKKYGTHRSTGNRADGATQIMDVVLMTCDKHRHDIMLKAKTISAAKRHGNISKKVRRIDDKEFNQDDGEHVSIKALSTERFLNESELEMTIQSMINNGPDEAVQTQDGSFITRMVDHDGKLVGEKQQKT